MPGGGSGGAVHGAAIDNDGGEVWATNCVLSANSCTGGSGGSGALAVSAGNGGEASGGAFFSKGGVYGFSGCQFVSNIVVGGSSGAGQNPSNASGTNGAAYGGAIASLNSTGSVVLSQFIVNKTTGGYLGAAFYSGEGCGGAVYNSNALLTARQCLFASNRAESGTAPRNGTKGPARGGAVANRGTLILTENYFRQNVAIGRVAERGGPHAFGGAVDNDTAGALTVTGCTFDSNDAEGGISVASLGIGGARPGGDAHGGGVYTSGTLEVANSTFVGNAARGGNHETAPLGGAGNGGALATAGATLLSHVTIASNLAVNGRGPGETQAGPGRGGGLYSGANAPTLRNSIVAHSTAGSNGFGAILDQGNNFSSDASFAFTQPGSRNNVDPLLSPLADFGGPTPTMALLAGSPAIDAALSSHCLPTDQRGRPRPWGAGCDVGAFEFKAYRFNGLTIDAVSAQGQTVVLAGRAGDVYEVHRAPSISGSWTAFSTNTIGPDGITTFDVPLGGGTSFLRARRLEP